MTTLDPQPDKLLWGVYQDFEEIEDEGAEEDEDNCLPSWYKEPILEISPYQKTWVVVQTFQVIELDSPIEVEPPAESFIHPYKETWLCHQESKVIIEFEPLEFSSFLQFDETLIGEFSLGVVLNSGLIGELISVIYDSSEFNYSGERGYTVKKILAEVKVFDSRHSQPGNIYQIPEDLGKLETEGELANPEHILEEPNNLKISNEFANFIVDSEGVDYSLVAGDGDQDDISILVSGNSNPSFDKPPGHLLASLSYEIVGSIATITAWSHPNWEDDAPLIKAVQTMISNLPSCIAEVQVEDDPTPFWTSLGFHSVIKGDPILRLYLIPNQTT